MAGWRKTASLVFRHLHATELAVEFGDSAVEASRGTEVQPEDSDEGSSLKQDGAHQMPARRRLGVGDEISVEQHESGNEGQESPPPDVAYQIALAFELVAIEADAGCASGICR